MRRKVNHVNGILRGCSYRILNNNCSRIWDPEKDEQSLSVVAWVTDSVDRSGNNLHRD